MNIARAVMPMPIHVKEAPLKTFLPKTTVRPGAPLSGNKLQIPWDNMDQGDNSEEEAMRIAPEPTQRQDIEELFGKEAIVPKMPGLRAHVPAWALSSVEGMENRVRKYSNNGRPGRGFRTRKRGGSRRKSTRSRKYKA